MNKLSQDILGGKKMKKRMFAALLAVSMMIGMRAGGSDKSSELPEALQRQPKVIMQDQTAAMMF